MYLYESHISLHVLALHVHVTSAHKQRISRFSISGAHGTGSGQPTPRVMPLKN